MKDPEHHFITKAINRLRIWFSKKKRLMLQAQDLQRQLAEAWRDKAQLEAENEALKRENEYLYRHAEEGGMNTDKFFEFADDHLREKT